MENYIFNKGDINQHIVKYGVDIRPAIVVKQDRQKLQDYCNCLAEKYPAAFETVLTGPERALIQKTFVTSSQKKIEMPTFAVTNRGLCFTFPVKFFIDNVEDFDISDRDKILRSAIKEFRTRFTDKKVVRIGQVDEIIFDCTPLDPIDILSSIISKEKWRNRLKTLAVHLENPIDEYNINLDLAPAYLQQRVQNPMGPIHNPGGGISVKSDINNIDMSNELTDDKIAAILAYADDYVPDGLIKFLNNE